MSSRKTSRPFAVGDWKSSSGASLRSGMMRSGIAYPLPPLAPLTAETESGLWPTPTISGGHNRKGVSKNSGDGLDTAVKLWPTLTVEDGESKGMSAARMAERGPDNLASAVKLWPTLASRDYRAPNAPDGPSRLSRPPTSGEQLPNAIGGVLNPDWCEKLMGYPPGYTDIRSK